MLTCFFFFFFKQKTAYEMLRSLVGSEMCIRDRYQRRVRGTAGTTMVSSRLLLIFVIGCLAMADGSDAPAPTPSPGCSTWDGECVSPYPGVDFLHPKIHQSPDCLHLSGWHDVAGAITVGGEHHVFQGCPSSQGWSHSVSSDLVHWEDRGRGVHSIHETYEGMDSNITPCSGFVTVDDHATPCAGFRQCGSNNGTTGLNPQAHAWDVPMELRCAENSNLTSWSEPIWIYPAYFYRPLPYDPVRPWKDTDGMWYSSWSTDGCNATTKKSPCAAGGQLELLASPALHGPGMDWKTLAPLFTTNMTKSGNLTSPGAITAEFVTSGYFGGLPGDPDGGSTRVITQNNGGPTFWVGKQSGPGQPFEAYWDRVGAVGHYDYGSLTMARTLGSDPNQVAKNGRKVLVGWIGGAVGSQSLGRDLSLSPEYELVQQFVPELQSLRQPGSLEHQRVTASERSQVVVHSAGSLQLEILATFSWSVLPVEPFGITLLGGVANITIDCTKNRQESPCMVTTPSEGPVLPIGTSKVVVHAILDHEILETIVNNRTGMVTYHTDIPSANSTGVNLFLEQGVTAEIATWTLEAANNAGPQP
eukprot:TRINITY_DN11645_c0_g1_i15.p1 TRINITY_DN11645_c0_g1~~TRINITY_DN11645_c0_g1_i15.p1  ORF type:complete len:585 (+),score=135.33 TRINITY_DN11645_c0_g1_i15:101-1855(+)